jgi:phosphate transport system permease protein
MMKARTANALAHAGLAAATLVVLLPLFLVVGVIAWKGAPAIDWELLTASPRGGNRLGGIFPVILGTVALVLLTIAIALPTGVFAAVYLREYAGDSRWARVVRLAILNLAGVPSVVHGLFGLGLFVVLCGFGTSLIAGALTLALLILPTIITATEEALRAVPDSIREAALALGATRWQTVWRAVLPNALPGILTGAILGVGRAAGETAPVMFTVAAFSQPFLPRSIFDQVMVLPYHLYTITTQVPDMPEAKKYATALVLLAVVLGLNLGAIVVRAVARRRAIGH